jgi:hypothetical protein
MQASVHKVSATERNVMDLIGTLLNLILGLLGGL